MSNFKQCLSLTASSFATPLFFRMANVENNVVTVTGMGYSTTPIFAVILSNRYQKIPLANTKWKFLGLNLVGHC